MRRHALKNECEFQTIIINTLYTMRAITSSPPSPCRRWWPSGTEPTYRWHLPLRTPVRFPPSPTTIRAVTLHPSPTETKPVVSFSLRTGSLQLSLSRRDLFCQPLFLLPYLSTTHHYPTTLEDLLELSYLTSCEMDVGKLSAHTLGHHCVYIRPGERTIPLE